jgi:hypothetical protein
MGYPLWPDWEWSIRVVQPYIGSHLQIFIYFLTLYYKKIFGSLEVKKLKCVTLGLHSVQTNGKNLMDELNCPNLVIYEDRVNFKLWKLKCQICDSLEG